MEKFSGNTDELIDKELEDNVADAYDEIFGGENFLYICTWNSEGPGKVKIGMLCAVLTTDMEMVKHKTQKVKVLAGFPVLSVLLSRCMTGFLISRQGESVD